MAPQDNFGRHLRDLREAQDLGVREFARAIGRSPTFVSRLENGIETAVSVETLEIMAHVLGEDPDVFLAILGKVSAEIQEIVRKRPVLFARLIRELKNVPDETVDRLAREVKDGDW